MSDEDDKQVADDNPAWTLMAAALEPVAPEPQLRERLLSQLRGPERFAPFASEIADAFGLDSAAVHGALTRVHDAGAWVPGPWPGSQLLATPELGRAQTIIARLPAASQIAEHDHSGRELTYVLDGALVEDGKRTLRSGELMVGEPGTRHAVAISDDSDCLVVFQLKPPAGR